MCIFVVLYLYIRVFIIFFYCILFSEQPPPLHARNTILNWRLLHMHCGALSFRTPLVFWRSLVHAAMFLPRACNKSLQENTSVFCKASCGLISAKELCLVGTSTTFCNVEHVICVAMPELCCLVSIQFPQTWWETMRNECWGIGLTEHVDLSRKVCLRVGLLKHAKRSNLARHRTIGWLRVADVSLMHLSRHSNATLKHKHEDNSCLRVSQVALWVGFVDAPWNELLRKLTHELTHEIPQPWWRLLRRKGGHM